MGTFEQTSEGSEEASCVGIWKKSIPGNGQCKGSEVGIGPPYFRTAQKTVWLECRSEGDSGRKRRT